MEETCEPNGCPLQQWMWSGEAQGVSVFAMAERLATCLQCMENLVTQFPTAFGGFRGAVRSALDEARQVMEQYEHQAP
jgi:hypothetical protein